jgi:hypothetical protein
MWWPNSAAGGQPNGKWFEFCTGKLGPRLDALQIPSFYTLSITSILKHMHEPVNVCKKNN